MALVKVGDVVTAREIKETYTTDPDTGEQIRDPETTAGPEYAAVVTRVRQGKDGSTVADLTLFRPEDSTLGDIPVHTSDDGHHDAAGWGVVVQAPAAPAPAKGKAAADPATPAG